MKKILYAEVDRMLSLGVIEELQNASTSQPLWWKLIKSAFALMHEKYAVVQLKTLIIYL